MAESEVSLESSPSMSHLYTGNTLTSKYFMNHRGSKKFYKFAILAQLTVNLLWLFILFT